MLISEMINAAYRKIGVVGHGEAESAEQAAAGLQAFNMLLHSLALDGIDLTLTPDGDPLADMVEYTAVNEVPVPSAFREGFVMMLANRMSPEFGLKGFDERSWKNAMRNALIKPCAAEFGTGLVFGALVPRWVR